VEDIKKSNIDSEKDKHEIQADSTKEKQKQNYLRFCSFRYDRLILEQNLTWDLFLSIQCNLILRKQTSYFFFVFVFFCQSRFGVFTFLSTYVLG